MNIENLPALVSEYGFVKSATAIQTLYNADLINESEARILLKRLCVMYLRQFNEHDMFITCNDDDEQDAHLFIVQDNRAALDKFILR